MKIFILKITLSLALVCSTAEVCNNKINNKISFDEIWALEMPETKDVRDLQEIPKALPNAELLRRSYVRQIEVALTHRNLPNYGEQPRSALVVQGSGVEALKEAARVLTEIAEKGNKKELELIQPAGKELSLVFYSYMCAHYVHIIEVNKEESTITVKYRFVSHSTANMSTHFALIPLGKLPKGTKLVKIVQERTLDKYGKPASSVREPRRYVSDSFTFCIE